jgi:aldose 1-epimerase
MKADPTAAATATTVLTLESGNQRVRLLPALGGAVASWDYRLGASWTPLLRAWDGVSDDRYTMACFPLLPWSNRITEGGFMHRGRHYPVLQNRAGEPYPIHGDGWLQAWSVGAQSAAGVTLTLLSDQFDGNPYTYRAEQTVTLRDDGIDIDLQVTHLGPEPLPYGLGLHPYFERNAATRLQSAAAGVWLSGADPIPTGHTAYLPPTWDYNRPAPLAGPLIDNCFDGWDGAAQVSYPDRGLRIDMIAPDNPGYSLLYRPPQFPYFCIEPITHPIDAFHMPGRPGLVELSEGQQFGLRTRFRVSRL